MKKTRPQKEDKNSNLPSVQRQNSQSRRSSKEKEKKQSEVKPEQKSYEIKERTQKTRNPKILKQLIGVLLVLSIAILVNLYFISPFSKVQEIKVVGIKDAKSEQIINSSDIQIGKGIWKQYFNKSSAQKRIVAQNPRIKTAKIELASFDELKISVTEYKTIGYLKKNDKFHVILENEKVLPETEAQTDSQYPVLINFKEDDKFTTFLKAYQQFDDKTKSNISEVESTAKKKNPYQIKLKMKDGNEVIGLSSTIAKKIVYYPKIVAEMKKPGVIDMEAGTSGIFSYEKGNDKEKTEESSESTDDSSEIITEDYY